MRSSILILLIFSLSGITLPGQSRNADDGRKLPLYFHCPSQQIADKTIASRTHSGDPMDETETRFTREMSYYAQQRILSGRVAFHDSLGEYITNVARILLKDDTALFSHLHFYVYESPDINAYTSATGNILVTIGLLAQLENEAQLAFILAHEITHYKQEHMLRGYVNREQAQSRNRNSRGDQWIYSIYSYNQEQEFEADRLGFDLYKRSGFAMSDAQRCFDILEYAELPFDDVRFDTTFFNDGFMKIPSGYFLKETDPVYVDDNEEDANSTHPNVRKRRMALLPAMDSVSDNGRTHFIQPADLFLRLRTKARIRQCHLLFKEGDYIQAIYCSYMMLTVVPGNFELQSIIANSLYTLAAYRQNNGNNGHYAGWYAGGRIFSNYGSLSRSSYYSVPDYKDHPGQQQQLYHLFSKMENDEMTVLALSYNWKLHKENPADSLRSSLCDSLFSMLINHQNLHRTFFSTITPDEARLKLREDSVRRVKETGLEGESKYSRLDKFRINSDKEVFVKFAFVEELKDSSFVQRFDYYSVHHRHNGNGVSEDSETDEEREQRIREEEKYGYGIQKIIIVNPHYIFNDQPDRRKQSEQNYGKSESGQIVLTKTLKNMAKDNGIQTVVLSPFEMDSTDADSFSDYAALNSWLYERLNYGNNNYLLNLNNKKEIDSIIARYGTPYVMFTGVEASYLKRIRRPVWFAISCLAVFPSIYGFIPKRKFTYETVVLDLRTGELIYMDYLETRKGKESELNENFFGKLFKRLYRPVKPPVRKPVAPEGLRD